MSQTLGVILMMNNYFHDVATALLLAGGVALRMMMNRLGAARDEAVREYFLALHRGMTRIVKIALVWIVLGGIPRVAFYTEFEWAHAAGKGQIPALLMKHLLFFVIVGVGARLWFTLNARVREMQKAPMLPRGQ